MTHANVKFPSYWDLLNEQDQAAYQRLQRQVEPFVVRTSREKTPENFTNILILLREWVEQGNENDWKRSLVTGILWIDDSRIAINTRQLHFIIGKCKSTINFGLQSVGFKTIPTDGECVSSLMKHFPFLRDRCMEVRQWTMRAKASPIIPSPMDFVSAHQLSIQSQDQIVLDHSVFPPMGPPIETGVLFAPDYSELESDYMWTFQHEEDLFFEFN